MSQLRREMGVRNQIKSIEKYVRGGGSKKKMTKLKKRAQQLETRLQQVITRETGAVASLTATMDAALAMTPAHQQAGYDAIVRMMRSGSTRGREETWERVLLAERFRNVLLARAFASGRHELDAGTEAAVDDGALATYAREINRNFSKVRGDLHKKRRLFGIDALTKPPCLARRAPDKLHSREVALARSSSESGRRRGRGAAADVVGGRRGSGTAGGSGIHGRPPRPHNRARRRGRGHDRRDRGRSRCRRRAIDAVVPAPAAAAAAAA
jgi:hypothetical protein